MVHQAKPATSFASAALLVVLLLTGTRTLAVSPISIGSTVSETIEAGDSSSFSLESEADASVLISLDQGGLDLVLSIRTAAGEARYNSPLGRDGDEYAVIELARGDTLEILVTSEEWTSAQSAMQLTVGRIESQYLAWQLMSEGAMVYGAGDSSRYAQAAELYLEAADLWKQSGDRSREAQALLSAAQILYLHLYQYPQAAALAADSGKLYLELGEHALGANALQRQATALIEVGNSDAVNPDVRRATYELAGSIFKAAEDIHRELGRAYDVGIVLNSAGYLSDCTGDEERALALFNLSATVLREAGEWSAVLKPLGNLSAVEARRGGLVGYIEAVHAILDSLPESESLERAGHLDRLASANRWLGVFDEAVKHYQSAMRLHRDTQDLHGEQDSLIGLGLSYFSVGENDDARVFLTQADALHEQTKDKLAKSRAQIGLGNISSLEGNHQEALDRHMEAMQYAPGDRDRAQIAVLVSRDHFELGNVSEANRFLDLAFEHSAGQNWPREKADVLLEEARVGLATDQSVSLQRLQEARDLYAILGLRREESESLHHLSLAYAQLDDIATALEFGEDSLLKLEALREEVANPLLRAGFSARRQRYYELQVGLWMTAYNGYASLSEAPLSKGSPSKIALRKAFETSERARSRITAELLSEASVDLRGGMDEGFTRRRIELLQSLAGLDYRLAEAEQVLVGDGPLLEIEAKRADVEHQLNLIDTELRRQNPDYASISAARVLELEEAQALLDSETALLHYALGEETSYAWVITEHDIEVVELSGRRLIEDAAKSAYERLAKRSRPASGALVSLADLVWTPVMPLLDRARIIVSADGALHYVPFAALPIENSTDLAVDRYEFVMVPSMSVLSGLRERRRHRQSDSIAIFADPVFSSKDDRWSQWGVSPTVSGPEEFQRLTHTKAEALAVFNVAPRQGRSLALDFDASRENVLNMDLRGYRYVHFATHGEIDAGNPEFSGLVLSAFDRRGNLVDGALRLDDIYNLKLDADLVVLSACETALGREVRGEGLIGLSQGFLYAGARSLVVSLWKVPDKATADLMARFYQHLLGEKMRPVSALRQAQRSLARDNPQWRDPFYWGAMVLVGDWT